MLKYFFTLISFVISGACQCQTIFTGKVTDFNSNDLFGATVTLSDKETESILKYTTTSQDGFFSIKIDEKKTSLVLAVSYIGLKKWKKTIENKNENFIVVLEESTEELKEIIIESYRIEQNADTLSYSVSAFKDQKDRTISDVLKKMPGIAVLPNGQITYQGNPIEKYYIEGLDLLEGRYNLANDNISAEDVSKVQILENHQPIKVLDSLQGSDRTSLNIKLKNNVSITGAGIVSAGYKPLLFSTSITPLMFSKRSQALISYEYNNLGKDLRRNTYDFSRSNSILKDFSSSTNDFLSVQNLSHPSFSSKRWLNNSDHYSGVNFLRRTKNDIDFKINISYLNGTRNELGSTRYLYILPDDNLNYVENISNYSFINSLNSKLTLEGNKEKSYFKNQLAFIYSRNSVRGLISNDSLNINQRHNVPTAVIENQLKIISPIGKQLFNFNSISRIENKEEFLSITPGVFPSILNDGRSYEGNIQTVKNNSILTENTFGFKKKTKLVTVSPSIGIAYKSNALSSKLFLNNNNSELIAENGFINDLSFSKTVFFITNELNFNRNNWKINFNSPLIHRIFEIDNLSLDQKNSLKKINFEPELSISKKISPFWESRLIGSVGNHFGTVENLYTETMLRNYRSLSSYDSEISQTNKASLFSEIKYRNALKAFFMNLSFSYLNGKSNLIYKSTVSNFGLLAFESVVRDNRSESKSINLGVSKYLKSIKTTLKFTSRHSLAQQEQIFNDQLDLFKSYSQNYLVSFESELNSWLSLSIQSNYNNSILKFKDSDFDPINNWENSVSAFFYIDDNQHLNFEGENYFNSGINVSSNTFINLSYQYTFKKPKIDLNIGWNNILNTKNFVTNTNNEFFSSENTYVIRPSQVLVSTAFSF